MFVLRCWGMHYDREDYDRKFNEVWTLGWVTKYGHCSRDPRQAYHFDNEADAWTYAASAELLGYDDDRGDWCFPEEVP